MYILSFRRKQYVIPDRPKYVILIGWCVILISTSVIPGGDDVIPLGMTEWQQGGVLYPPHTPFDVIPLLVGLEWPDFGNFLR